MMKLRVRELEDSLKNREAFSAVEASTVIRGDVQWQT